MLARHCWGGVCRRSWQYFFYFSWLKVLVVWGILWPGWPQASYQCQNKLSLGYRWAPTATWRTWGMCNTKEYPSSCQWRVASATKSILPCQLWCIASTHSLMKRHFDLTFYSRNWACNLGCEFWWRRGGTRPHPRTWKGESGIVLTSREKYATWKKVEEKKEVAANHKSKRLWKSNPSVEGRFKLGNRKKFFTKRMLRHWNKLPREAMVASSLEVFSFRLDGNLCSLI